MQFTLKDIFENYSQHTTKIFKKKDALTDQFLPSEIPHRDEQIQQLGRILAPALRKEKISNTFLFGITGTGKTIVTKYVASELEKNTQNIQVLYVNCKMKKVSDTEYRLIAELCRLLGKEVPATGLPTEQVYRMFFECVEQTKQNIILILDEIDHLVKKVGDDVLYSLTRINQDFHSSKLALIGISNDVSFTDNLDPRVKSSLSEEEIIFPPYNAKQLSDILEQRAEMAFFDNVVGNGVVAKCAALAAQEHGDARKALDILRISGEIAERHNSTKIITDHIDKAESKLDTDRTLEIIKVQPKQSLALIAAIIKLMETKKKKIETGDVFSLYQKICTNRGLKILTHRRVSDLLGELEMLGIIRTTLISKGRYGRTKEITLLVNKQLVEKIKTVLTENYLLDALYKYS